MPGYSSPDPVHATILSGTSTLQCQGGIIGSNVGAANDTLFMGAYIPLHTPAVTLTITELLDQGGTARSWVITGSTTADTSVSLTAPILNEFGAFTFTPSVSNLIVVYTRAFTGGA